MVRARGGGGVKLVFGDGYCFSKRIGWTTFSVQSVVFLFSCLTFLTCRIIGGHSICLWGASVGYVTGVLVGSHWCC